MTAIVNHVAQAQGLLIKKLRGKPALNALLGAVVEECQELEYVFQQLKYLTLLEFANGLQLDRIGDAVDQTRQAGQDDQNYKVALRIAIIRNTADGTPDAAIRLIAALTNATTITYTVTGVASPTFTHNGTFVPDLITRLRDIAPVGCRVILLTQPGDPIPEQG